MTQDATAAPPTRRERLRQATLLEIVDAAKDQLRTVGPQGLTLSAVARELGLTAPALYRYVDGVDGLLTLLVTEGYRSLSDLVEQRRDAVPLDDPGGRFQAVAFALREWALEDPAQYGLLFGSPIPGYAAPADGPTTAGAHRAAGTMWQVLIDAKAEGLLGTPLVHSLDPLARTMLDKKEPDELRGALASETLAAGWAALSLLLGAVAVEVFGHMPSCDAETADALFRSKVLVAGCIVGLPDPR